VFWNHNGSGNNEEKIKMNSLNSKQLHKHAIPVIVLVVGLFMISALALSNDINSNNSVPKGLFTRVVHVKFSANWLAKVTLQDSTADGYTNIGQASQTAARVLESSSVQ
jgi:hypothetical protein